MELMEGSQSSSRIINLREQTMKSYLHAMIAASLLTLLMITGCVSDPICGCKGDQDQDQDQATLIDSGGSGWISLHYSGASTGQITLEGRGTSVAMLPGGEFRGNGCLVNSVTRKVTSVDSSGVNGARRLGLHQVLAECSLQLADSTHNHLSLYLFRVDSLDNGSVRRIKGGENYDVSGDLTEGNYPGPGHYATVKLRLGATSADYALADKANNRLYSNEYPGADLSVNITSTVSLPIGEVLTGTMMGNLINARGDTLTIVNAAFNLQSVRIDE
jgi:hypothetical protein